MKQEIFTICTQQRKNADILYPHIKPLLVQPKTVLVVAGGSGSGKSGMSLLLQEKLAQDDIQALVLHGDDYPHLIPSENDKKRLEIFEKGGEEALAHYLGSAQELNFAMVNGIIRDFKQGRHATFWRHLGRNPGEVERREQVMDGASVLIIEWTHGLSPLLTGADCRILLDTTPEETLQSRLERNRDAGADSPFVAMVLRLEQAQIEKRRTTADLIQKRNGAMTKCTSQS